MHQIDYQYVEKELMNFGIDKQCENLFLGLCYGFEVESTFEFYSATPKCFRSTVQSLLGDRLVIVSTECH